MPGGEGLTVAQRSSVDRAIRQADRLSGLTFSVYVGPVEGDLREHGRRLLAALGGRADDTVLLLVDPSRRRLEVLTGRRAATRLDDRSAALGAMSMTSGFAVGDLAGGIVDGLRTLAEHSRQPRVQHVEQP